MRSYSSLFVIILSKSTFVEIVLQGRFKERNILSITSQTKRLSSIISAFLSLLLFKIFLLPHGSVFSSTSKLKLLPFFISLFISN